MGNEIMRMLKGKGFWLGFMTAMAGISLGASYPELQGLLNPGSFVDMETEALKSNAMIFFLPLAAVLPWSDSFIRERQGGFLKTALPRTGRRYYVESKVFTTALGGFLSVFLAGALMFLAYFMIFSSGGSGKIPMGPDGGAWKNPASLRTCGSGFKHRRRDFCRAYRIGISGFWIPLCSLLFLCDFKGSVFKKSAVALPASMD